MQAPAWATHEIVFNRGSGPCRVWVSSGGYSYYESNGKPKSEAFTRHDWGIDGWISAINDSSYTLISAGPIHVELENK